MGHETLLLSEQSASSTHRRLALVAAVALVIAFLGVLSLGDRQLPHLTAYVPIVDALMFLSDLVTATLLYSQYYVGRQRSALALAMGYLFASLIIVPDVLTFPGNFSPGGLLGANVDTAFWLYYFCRLGLFIAVIAYSLLKGTRKSLTAARIPIAVTIASGIAAVVLLVLLMTLLAIHSEYLPRVMLDSLRRGLIWNRVLAPALILVSVTAVALLWRHRS